MRSLPVDRKEQSESGDGLFSSRELVHISEPLHWRHSVVLDTGEVRLLQST
jgi:hypothetical protein